MQNPDSCPNAQALPEIPPWRGKPGWWFILLNVAMTYDNAAMMEYWIYDRDIFM